MASSSLQSYLGFLNNVLFLGKEYEEFGCSPRNIQCFVSRVDEKNGNIWLKPIKTSTLDVDLEKLCQSFLINIHKKKLLENYAVGNIGLCITESGDLIGRCRIVGKDKKERPIVQRIDSGVIYGSLNKSCIYKLDAVMTESNFAFPLCFVARSLPTFYLNKYRMLGVTDIHAGDFVNVNIVNITGTIVHALFSSCTKMITSIKYDYIGLDAFGKKNVEWSQFCDSNKYNVIYKHDCQVKHCHEINDVNTAGYVVGIPDEESFYVRPVSLSIAYCYFLDVLTNSYSVGEFNKLLIVEKVVPDDVGKTFVFFDSITIRFYRVEITGVGNKRFSCYCIDQPSLLFLNIENKSDILWRLSSTFLLPRFYCEVKIGDFKNQGSLMSNNDVSLRRITTLKNLFKENNLVTIERRSSKKFPTVRHEGLDLVENYKNIMFNIYHDEMTLTKNSCGVFKEPSLRKKGAFTSSMNASFKGKGKTLGHSLKAQCSMKFTGPTSNEMPKINSDDIFSFGSFKAKKNSEKYSNNELLSDYVSDELADELCEYVSWDFGFNASQANESKTNVPLTEFLKLNVEYSNKIKEEHQELPIPCDQNWSRPNSSLSNSTTTSKDSLKNCRAVRFKDISFKDSLNDDSENSTKKNLKRKSPDVSDCDSGLSHSGTSSTENINHSENSIANSYLKKKLKFSKSYAVVNINNVDDIRIFNDDSLKMYLKIHDTLMKLDENQLKKVPCGKTMPDTTYILEYKDERYRVFRKDNYLTESGDSDSDIDQSFTSTSCRMDEKKHGKIDVSFIEYDTKREFVFNNTNDIKIYECPNDIKNIPKVLSEVVSLAGEHKQNLKIRDYICLPKATEYLKSLLPPFKFKENAYVKFTSSDITGKKIVTIRNAQGKSISPFFSDFCQKLAESGD